jgi:putative sugar O-methyltransferase
MSFATKKKGFHVRFLRLLLGCEKLFYQNANQPSLKKIKLADNIPLSDQEFTLTSKFCDIFAAIGNVAAEKVTPPDGGLFWSVAKQGNGPFDLHLRKDRNEIDHSFLLNTRFRDFPGMAYELDEFTPQPDFWIRRYIRLANAVPKQWRVKIPARFGEIGWNVQGFPVNRLTAINQERLTAMRLSGIIRYLEQQAVPKIMEIGAGSGEMGYALCKALPNATWYDCDLLGSLVYSTLHLAVLLPEKRHYVYVGDLALPSGLDESLLIRSTAEAAQLENAIVNIPNFLLPDFAGHLQLHLACNTYSFAEMPQSAVEEYAVLLAQLLQERGILFEQNGYFPEKNQRNVEEILGEHFKQQIWRWDNDFGPVTLLSGATRTWSNNAKTEQLYQDISTYQLFKLIDSLNDGQDANDIEFPNIIWEKVEALFPNCG